MARRKLVVLEDSSQCHFGGGQKVTLDVIDIVSNLYSEVIVLDYADSLFTCKLKEKDLSKISVRRLRKIKGLIGVINYFLNLAWILKCIAGCKVDLYITTKTGVLYLLPLRLFVRRAIYHGHNVERSEGLYFKAFLLLFIFFDRIICVSNCVRGSYPLLLRDLKKFDVLYNTVKESGCDGERNIDPGDRMTVVYVGSLIPIKSVDTLIAAFVNTNLLDDVDLHIYGDGTERGKLEALAGGDERIKFMGFSESISSNLSQYDLLVLPTKIEEACPMVLLEGMFRGLPLLVSDHGGQLELLKIYGFGSSFAVGDAQDCAEKISLLLTRVRGDELAMSMPNRIVLEEFKYTNFRSRILGYFCE